MLRAFSPERTDQADFAARRCQNRPGYKAAGRGRRASRRLGSLASLSPRSTILQPVRARSDGLLCPSGASESSAHVCCMIRKASWRNSARHISASSERALSALMSYPHPCQRPRLSLPRATGTANCAGCEPQSATGWSAYIPCRRAIGRPAASSDRHVGRGVARRAVMEASIGSPLENRRADWPPPLDRSSLSAIAPPIARHSLARHPPASLWQTRCPRRTPISGWLARQDSKGSVLLRRTCLALPQDGCHLPPENVTIRCDYAVTPVPVEAGVGGD